MPNEQFQFPDEQDVSVDDEPKKKASAPEDEIEVEIVDDVPEADRGRKALDEVVDDPTDEEVSQYSAKVQDRIKKLTHARHDERRQRETIQRERDELERLGRSGIVERDQRQKQFGDGGAVVTTP